MREAFDFPPRRRPPPAPAHCRGRTLDFGRVRLMGVLNVTPDSFSDGGLFLDPAAAADQGRRMAEEGADIIDVGGESTRPGSEPVEEAEEMRRVIPVIERLAGAGGPLLSVDTRRPAVARAALAAGAHIVNDVTGLIDPDMRRMVAEAGAAAVIMHMKGAPRTMQENPVYRDVVREVGDFLRRRAAEALRAGVRSVFLDPGVGFGKTWDHNLELLRGLGELAGIGCPLVVGVSRKAFIGAATGVAAPAARLVGSKVAEAWAVWGGADVIRTHDVGAAREAVRMAEAIARGRMEENSPGGEG